MKKLLFALLASISLLFIGCDADDVNGDAVIDNSKSETVEQLEGDLQYDTINLDEIEHYVNAGYIIADVREIEEYQSGHIPGAINAPLSRLKTGEYGPLTKDEKYVIICRSGNRSITASHILTENGFNVVNVSEGVSTWTGELIQE